MWKLVHQLDCLENRVMIDRQPMKTLSFRNDMWVLGEIMHNYSKTVLNTLEPAKIKSRETSKQGITVVETTCNQGVCSQNSFMRAIPSEFFLRSLI